MVYGVVRQQNRANHNFRGGHRVPLATSSYTYWITPGSDGALWFTENYSSQVGRITTAGAITEYPMPSPSQPFVITRGPDGALWFTEWDGNKVARMTTTGVLTEYPVPTAASEPNGITVGPDGALWFTEWEGNKVERVPACGLGLSASFANSTLTTNFDLGIDTPATFDVILHSATGKSVLLSHAIQPVVPPLAFTKIWRSVPNLGTVEVEAGLAAPSGQPICEEWTTVSTAP